MKGPRGIEIRRGRYRQTIRSVSSIAGAREIWQASMTHIAPEGGYFVLSAYQFCRRENCMFSPEHISGGSNGDISIDKILCSAGSVTVSPSGQDRSTDLGSWVQFL
nr:bifunctional nitrilase/nitrile hydratase NIT4A-like isoform X1 [Quercus suber]